MYGANEIILVEEDLVNRTNVNIIWTTQDYIISQDKGIAGKTIATSRLSFATNGTPIEIINPDTSDNTSPTEVKKIRNEKSSSHHRSSKL